MKNGLEYKRKSTVDKKLDKLYDQFVVWMRKEHPDKIEGHHWHTEIYDRFYLEDCGEDYMPYDRCNYTYGIDDDYYNMEHDDLLKSIYDVGWKMLNGIYN